MSATAFAQGMVYLCRDERRRSELRRQGPGGLNGIDFLEVVDQGAADPALRQRILLVHLVHPAEGELAALAPGNVFVDGGERIPTVEVRAVEQEGRLVTVRVARPGDFSTYTLRLASPDGQPLPGLDPLLAAVQFSFKADCPSPFDCAPVDACPPARAQEPVIDYLARDYASFRQLMLDRMSLLLPGWKERSPADAGVTLVELLAYVADHLAYRQDVVATEAYLGTARRRVSVRRHARLLDYAMHDGSNARVWVHVRVDPALLDGVDGDGQPLGEAVHLPAGTPLCTRVGSAAAVLDPREAPALGPAEVFETMHEARLRPALNEIRFHTWGQRDCCLPRGATRATLRDDPAARLALRAGDVLLLEEVRGPRTGEAADADPARRHAVRLTRVVPDADDPVLLDPLLGTAIVEVEWSGDDALPFPLVVSSTTDAEHGARQVEDVAVARGNVVLADHGRTVVEAIGAPARPDPRLAPVGGEDGGCCGSGGGASAPPARFRPRLTQGPLTQAARTSRTVVVQGRRERLPFDPGDSAASALRWEMERVVPAIRVVDGTGRVWHPQKDLLASDSFAPEFVVEVDDDGRASLRFGDDRHGERPSEGVEMVAEYRVGSGARGNVGADSIRHLLVDTRRHLAAAFVSDVRNPLPARGGRDPEPVEEARQNAPAAFRTLARAVTPDDYARLAERHPEVQRAQATLRWTGSWRTVFLTVDRLGGRPVDAAFEAQLRAHLERFRMAGHDLEIDGPRFVALEVELRVQVLPAYFRSDVRAALLERLGSGTLRDGRRGFFHPDHFTFGQGVPLSGVYAAAQAVAGVERVEVARFQRLGMDRGDALESGELAVGALEVARLDNDPSFPERGILTLVLEGGR